MEDWRKQLEDHISDMDRSTDIRKKAATTLYYKYQTPEGELIRKKLGESIRTSEKYQQSIKNRDQSYKYDPEFAEAHAQRMRDQWDDPEFRQKHLDGVRALREDPERWEEYRKNYIKGNTEKLDNPEYWKAYYAGIAKRDADIEYRQDRLKKSRNKIRKPVRTPLGVFETQTDASLAHGFSNTERIRHRIKSPTFPDYQEITVEEYEKHKSNN